MLKILMVSGEYPPMRGGVGRYTENLVKALKKFAEVTVACDVSCKTDEENIYKIISPDDRHNSDKILNLVNEISPDVIHIQLEPYLYDVEPKLTHFFKNRYISTLDKLYRKENKKIITTPHSVVPFDEYWNFAKETVFRRQSRYKFLPSKISGVARKWVIKKRLAMSIHYSRMSKQVVNLSDASKKAIGHGTTIYHGAEPTFFGAIDKKELRKEFGLPDDKMLLVASGYAAEYKGFDMLKKIKPPKNWKIVVKQTTHERTLLKPIPMSNVISVNDKYFSDQKLSKLFFSCDAVILPYRTVSISGVLFDAFAHGLPFVASDLKFFKEFASLGLGVAVERNVQSLSKAIELLDSDYSKYKKNVERFQPKLKWSTVASNHINLYQTIQNS